MINFKHFKKISEDNKKAILRHPDGHEVHVAKAPLSESMRSRLESIQPEKVEPGTSDQAMDRHNAEVRNNRGMPQKLAAGGAAGPCRNPNCASHGQVHPNCRCYAHGGCVEKHAHGCQMAAGGEVGGYNDESTQEGYGKVTVIPDPAPALGKVIMKADGGEINSSEPSIWDTIKSGAREGITAMGQDPYATGVPAAAEMATQQAQQQPAAQQAPVPVPESSVQPQPQQQEMSNQSPSFNQSGLIAAQQEQVQKQQELMQRYQQSYQDIDNESKAFMHDIGNQHIDPQHYMKSMGPVGQIGTAIALLALGANGMGGGAMQYIQDQQNKDIEAQKMELGKKENLLSANFKRMGNMHDAVAMTKIMQNEVLAGKIALEATKLQSPLEQAKMRQQYQLLDYNIDLMKRQLAASKVQQGNAAPDQRAEMQRNTLINIARMNDPKKAEDMASRNIPGHTGTGEFGLAGQVVPDAERKDISSREDFLKRMSELLAFSKQHAGSWNPKDIERGESMAMQVQSAYREASNQGVFKQSAAEFDKALLGSSPTSLLASIRSQPKYEQVLKDSLDAHNRRLGIYGINPIGIPGAASQSATPQSLGFKPRKP